MSPFQSIKHEILVKAERIQIRTKCPRNCIKSDGAGLFDFLYLQSAGSWGIIEIFSRRSRSPISAMSISSMQMDPDCNSTSLHKAEMELLPAPVVQSDESKVSGSYE